MSKTQDKTEVNSSNRSPLNIFQWRAMLGQLKAPGSKVAAEESQPSVKEELLRDNSLKVVAKPEVKPEPELPKLSELRISEDTNPIIFQLQLFRRRNAGAHNFDDFARGIQTWLSVIELEAIRRFHDLHLDPIVEAMEDYVLKAAQSLKDLIDKALLLCNLKVCRKAAQHVAQLALKKIEEMLSELNRVVPSELLFTWKQVELLRKEFATVPI